MKNGKSHDYFMSIAIEVAKESEKEGGIATGAIMVKGGEVIANGKSLVTAHNDPSEHAETNCIRNACKKLGTTNLEGCILYGTLEPCHMCLSCAAWGNLPRIFFGAYKEDIPGNNFEVKEYHAEVSAKTTQLWSGKPIHMKGGILRTQCAELLEGYKNWTKS